MKCPVCEKQVMECEKKCPQCGWIFAEDVTVYGALFGEMQLDVHQAEYRVFAAQYRESVDVGAERFNTNMGEHGPAKETDTDSGKTTRADNRPPWLDVFDWLNDDRSATRRSEVPTQEEQDAWAEALNQSVMQMMNPEKNRSFRERVERDFLGPWREELERDPDFRLEESDYAAIENHEYVRDPSMPMYQWLNWQMRSPRNLKDVLGPEIRRYERMTGERRPLIDEICCRISDGTFENLYVGDYFDVKLRSGEKVRLVLAGFSNANGTHVDVHGNHVEYYAVVVPEHCLERKESMDKSFWGLLGYGMGYGETLGYENSYMYNEVLPAYADDFQWALNDHVLRRIDAKELQLMNLCHLYGEREYLGYDGFPLFVLHPDMIEARRGFDGNRICSYWLSDQLTKGYFLNNESEEVAEHKKLGVRPYFCIG